MSSSEKSLLAGVPTGLFIGGVWRDAVTGRRSRCEDPATGEVLTQVAGRVGGRRSGGAGCGGGGAAGVGGDGAAGAGRDPAVGVRG